MARDDIYSVTGQRVEVGLSSIIGVTAIAGQNAAILKYASGGTLEIGGASLTWGQGYVMGSTESIPINLSGTVYLASAGATSIVYVLRGVSS